jgi:hypothetical protein
MTAFHSDLRHLEAAEQEGARERDSVPRFIGAARGFVRRAAHVERSRRDFDERHAGAWFGDDCRRCCAAGRTFGGARAGCGRGREHDDEPDAATHESDYTAWP